MSVTTRRAPAWAHRSPSRRLTRRHLRLVPVLALAVVLTGLTALSDSPAQAASAGWIVRCDFSHAKPHDPILYPRQRAKSHLHDFVGNVTTNAFSTYRSMTRRDADCTLPQDTAGYWTPALYRNGRKIDPAGSSRGEKVTLKIYYRADNLRPGTTIVPFPKDMRIITGNSKATRPGQNPKVGSGIYWGCSDNSTGKLPEPPASCESGIISLHVGFPNCWNGTLTHKDDSRHVVYPSDGRCPRSHPVALPRMIFRWEYPVGLETGTITLASGNVYSMHADFWNTWRQPKLARLVARCLNGGVNCRTPGG